MTPALLEARGVSKRFGGVQALQGIDLAAAGGEVHGLIGPNGAGKSTLLGCITGVYAIDDGTVAFRGRAIDRLPVHRRARLGIARTFQKIRLARELSVFENVAAGLAATHGTGLAALLRLFRPLSSAEIAGPVMRALDIAGIAGEAGAPVSSLPYGKRHFVELARALVADPAVVLLDEPASGLTAAERRRLSDTVGALAAAGAAVILVEHDLLLVGEVCDRVTVLDYGRRIFTGTPADAQRDPEVVRAYLGSARFAKD
jgi:ABC-type branched-subunit amino acid transport system ATPase component